MGIDIAAVAESVASSPFGLTTFLLLGVWILGSMVKKSVDKSLEQVNELLAIIKQKDEAMDKLIKEVREDAEERERWWRDYFSRFGQAIIEMRNDIGDIWSLFRQGGNIFERQGKDSRRKSPSVIPIDDDNINHSRGELSTTAISVENSHTTEDEGVKAK